MGSGAEHTADEAGGEAVFSSDGLPSLLAPLPPPVINSAPTTSNDSGDDNVDAVIEESSTPVDVFESFHAHANAVGWSGLSKTTIDTDSTPSYEDPRRALFRLREEVDRLEGAFAVEGQKHHETSDANDHYQLQQLKSRLDNMLGDDASADITLDKLLRGRQEDLSRVIAKDVQNFQRGDLSEDMDKLNISAVGDDKNKIKDGKIVYELYSYSLGQQQQNPSPRAATLEERLRKLETVLGSTATATDATSKSLLERLNDAERLTKEMDVKEVDKLAAKAKVVRSDLEAAARARQKLASSSSSSRVNDEDARTLTALHTHLVELEGISTYLPALTVRLTELATLHSNAAEFGERLNVCEEAANRSEKMLESVEKSLNKMEEGWKGNMEVVERNVNRLDEMLKGSM
eukprot:CAMPEP_0201716708 /NCGR_PEP_ID=MMETSP0593-20130828/2628_1 /ASSEMBLY_ACC=CAM_ASM_000672 /TAXON_ID=267983 /ORGANISM="Skeletonema japonicum, Strain CCMP2506" /LENGTH=403 /DNA_ID=CAMNT_0048206577 /DNA_START=21 /DNA_END=1232 /DNA_ORIENTATION=+